MKTRRPKPSGPEADKIRLFLRAAAGLDTKGRGGYRKKADAMVRDIPPERHDDLLLLAIGWHKEAALIAWTKFARFKEGFSLSSLADITRETYESNAGWSEAPTSRHITNREPPPRRSRQRLIPASPKVETSSRKKRSKARLA